MSQKRRQFNKDFKVHVLNEIDAGKSIAQTAREFEVHPTQIQKWKKELSQYGEKAFSGNGKLYKEEARIAELERVVGQLTMENSLLKKALNMLRKKD